MSKGSVREAETEGIPHAAAARAVAVRRVGAAPAMRRGSAAEAPESDRGAAARSTVLTATRGTPAAMAERALPHRARPPGPAFHGHSGGPSEEHPARRLIAVDPEAGMTGKPPGQPSTLHWRCHVVRLEGRMSIIPSHWLRLCQFPIRLFPGRHRCRADLSGISAAHQDFSAAPQPPAEMLRCVPRVP